MVASVFSETTECSRGWRSIQSAAIPMQMQNERYMATPPKRGRGLEWRCRSWEGTATQPLRLAKSRTYRVSTKEDSSDARKIAKKMTVKLRHLGSGHA